MVAMLKCTRFIGHIRPLDWTVRREPKLKKDAAQSTCYSQQYIVVLKSATKRAANI